MAQYFSASGSVTDTAADIVCLAGNLSGTNHFMTLEYPGGTDYQVPAGKTLVITRVIYYSPSTASTLFIGYGDNGVAEGTTGPTNRQTVSGKLLATTSNTQYIVDCAIPIPSQKYPYILADLNSFFVMAIGVLQ